MKHERVLQFNSQEYCRISANYEVKWYENDGNESFTTHIIREGLGDGSPTAVIAADIDLDGDPDVIASYYITQGIIWYENMIIS